MELLPRTERPFEEEFQILTGSTIQNNTAVYMQFYLVKTLEKRLEAIEKELVKQNLALQQILSNNQ